MKICLCQVCHEAWPLYVKSKKKIPYVCTRCLCDKRSIKKFSYQNADMIPSAVPEELQGLTLVEEMLLARTEFFQIKDYNFRVSEQIVTSKLLLTILHVWSIL